MADFLRAISPKPFDPRSLLYTKGSQFLDPIFAVANTDETFNKLLEDRVSSSQLPEELSATLIRGLKDARGALSVWSCANLYLPEFVGVLADSPLIQAPPDKVMHGLMNIKIMDALLDACRDDDDLAVSTGSGPDNGLGPFLAEEWKLSRWDSTNYDALTPYAQDLEKTPLIRALVTYCNPPDRDAVSGIMQTGSSGDDRIQTPQDSILSRLASTQSEHEKRSQRHALIARILALSILLRAWLMRDTKQETMTKYIKQNGGSVFLKRGEAETCCLLYSAAVYGPWNSMSGVPPILKRCTFDGFMVTPPSRDAWLARVNRLIWRTILKFAVCGHDNLERTLDCLRVDAMAKFKLLPPPQEHMHIDDSERQKSLPLFLDSQLSSPQTGDKRKRDLAGGSEDETEDEAYRSRQRGGSQSPRPSIPQSQPGLPSQRSFSQPPSYTPTSTQHTDTGGRYPFLLRRSSTGSRPESNPSRGEGARMEKDPNSPSHSPSGSRSEPAHRRREDAIMDEDPNPPHSPSGSHSLSDRGHGEDASMEDNDGRDETENGANKDTAVEGGKGAVDQPQKAPSRHSNRESFPPKHSGASSSTKKNRKRKPIVSNEIVPLEEDEVYSEEVKEELEHLFAEVRDKPAKEAKAAFVKLWNRSLGIEGDPWEEESDSLEPITKVENLSENKFIVDITGVEIPVRKTVHIPLVESAQESGDGGLNPSMHEISLELRNHPRLTRPRGDYARFQGIMDRVRLCHEEGKSGIRYYTKQAFEGMDRATKLVVLAQHVVVVKGRQDNLLQEGVGGQEHFDSKRATRPTCKEVLQELRCHLQAPHQISDSTMRPLSQDGHAERHRVDAEVVEVEAKRHMLYLDSLEQMNTECGVYNCLDLSLQFRQSAGSPLHIFDLSDVPTAKQFRPWSKIQPNTPLMEFALYGKNSAFSRIHCDPEGVTSEIRVRSGSKIWAVMTKGEHEQPGHPVTNLSNYKDWYAADWDAAYLEEDDTIIMPPGTFHAVMTVRDSVSTGGMFHIPSSYTKMLRTQLQLHLDGQRLSNSDYPGSHIDLFDLCYYYYNELNNRHLFDDSTDLAELEQRYRGLVDSNIVPTAKELAALVLAVRYSHRLTPQQNEDEVTKTWPIGYLRARIRAQKQWAHVLQEKLVDRLEAEFSRALQKEVEATLKVRPNRQQRDLPESTRPVNFYHDNEHERRFSNTKGPWEPEEGSEWSEGEFVPDLEPNGS